MQQSIYNKLILVLLGLVIFCTIIAAFVVVFFLSPMIMFGGEPTEMGTPHTIPVLPTMPDDVIEDLKKEIMAKKSVIAFKETFPDYRDEFEESYGLGYTIQARNVNTGNILSLQINYNPMGPPHSNDKYDSWENIQCIPGEKTYISEGAMPYRHFGGGDAQLFLHESIKDSNCLEDDWEVQMLTEDEVLP